MISKAIFHFGLRSEANERSPSASRRIETNSRRKDQRPNVEFGCWPSNRKQRRQAEGRNGHSDATQSSRKGSGQGYGRAHRRNGHESSRRRDHGTARCIASRSAEA